jgi:hypothetical protein
MTERFQARYRGKRYSPGYPACPELADETTIFRLCRARRSASIDRRLHDGPEAPFPPSSSTTLRRATGSRGSHAGMTLNRPALRANQISRPGAVGGTTVDQTIRAAGRGTERSKMTSGRSAAAHRLPRRRPPKRPAPGEGRNSRREGPTHKSGVGEASRILGTRKGV